MRGVLRWNSGWSLPLFGFFLAVDLLFFSANMLKIEEGGWFPLAVAALVYTVMATWRRGRELLVAARAVGGLPLETFLALDQARPSGAGARHRGVHDRQQQHGAERAACTTSSTTRCCPSA